MEVSTLIFKWQLVLPEHCSLAAQELGLKHSSRPRQPQPGTAGGCTALPGGDSTAAQPSHSKPQELQVVLSSPTTTHCRARLSTAVGLGQASPPAPLTAKHTQSKARPSVSHPDIPQGQRRATRARDKHGTGRTLRSRGSSQ